MGVYNPNVDMPVSCAECDTRGGSNCFLSNQLSYPDVLRRRHPDCPLVEVKAPHGRLIDENALLREFETRDWLNGKTLLDYLLESQTIIEAEGIYSVATSTVYEKQLHKERVKEDAD